jgi:hypothetical protein
LTLKIAAAGVITKLQAGCFEAVIHKLFHNGVNGRR